MKTDIKSAAIILASGSGQRFDSGSAPKHLTPIMSVPILVWTLKTVLEAGLFASIVVVTRTQDIESVNRSISQYFTHQQNSNIRVVEGAPERNETFGRGVHHLLASRQLDKGGLLALFDANRPFAPLHQIKMLFEMAMLHSCSCPARPVINGIAEMRGDRIISVPPKSTFYEFVTPEFLKLGGEELSNGNFLKEHASLVEYALHKGIQPVTTLSSLLNSKLTYPEDQSFLEGLAVSESIPVPQKV